MRELKFRAWDKVEKKMLFDADPFAIHVYGSNEPLLAETHRNEDCIFEQYTGLNDKNGKEIYEGDIILVDNRDYSPYIVVYREWDCSYIGENDDREEIVHIYKNVPQRYEVIGNIHENPELLGGKE